jgi:hypothetical protein
MPLLILILTLTSAFLFSVSYMVNLYSGQVKAEKYQREVKDYYPPLPAGSYNFVEDINGQLIRLCQIGQAMIIRCQECYAEGKKNCPYPTDEFCRSAVNIDYNDPHLVWGFLPNEDGNGGGDLKAIWEYDDGGCDLDPDNPEKDLKSVNCLPQYIRLKARKVLDPTLVQIFDIKYQRPTERGNSTDICAVDGLITTFSKKD